jgi:hypothetical protein
MIQDSWTWDDQENSLICRVLGDETGDLGWCDYIEKAPADPLVGKVLCVCVAAGIAREVLASINRDDAPAKVAIELLDRWIDEPTDERFERIGYLIFEEGSPEFDAHGVVLWALRTATSSVGNSEAGWALMSLCAGAMSSGFSVESLRGIAARELQSRRRLG